VADQISDALLDAFLEKDPNTRAGIEVMIKDNIVVLGGEVKSMAQIDYDHIVRETMDNVGYPDDHHLSGEDVKVINLIGKQSPEISRSVDQDDGIIGAGDQGFCVGFASNETEDLMPLGAYLARKLCQCAEDMHHTFGPDIKSQVVVSYDEEGKGHVDSILVSTMHQCSLEECRAIIRKYIMDNGMCISENLFHRHILGDSPEITINPSGEWHIGGSISDCGMTNRKIVVDQYGGYAPVGGGGLSGKDMSKVDRSATYMCRYLAKNIVAAGLADTAKVELAYMIGVPQPCAINVELNRNQVLSEAIKTWISDNIDLTPLGIMLRFDGSKPRYNVVTQFGHFGLTNREQTLFKENNYFPWEETDLVPQIQDSFRPLISK
jgi:S-adenosylmethionine synthetase